MRVALATCKRLPEPDPDEAITLEAFRAAGHEPFLLPWDGRETWSADVVLVRSTWNYPWKHLKFVAWVVEAARRSLVLNPPDVIRWNLHKGYLAELEKYGIPIVPSAWFRRGRQERPLSWDPRWKGVVVKPSISAGSWLTKRFPASERVEAEAYLAEKLRARDMMVQPYLASVEDEGEHAIVWIDGEATHAVRKSPRFSEDVERVSPGVAPTPEQLDLAEAVISSLPKSVLYARIDVMRDDSGRLAVSEVELIEPSLFFVQRSSALERFVAAVETRAAAAGIAVRAGRFEA